jgi:hypothetical protein
MESAKKKKKKKTVSSLENEPLYGNKNSARALLYGNLRHQTPIKRD